MRKFFKSLSAAGLLLLAAQPAMADNGLLATKRSPAPKPELNRPVPGEVPEASPRKAVSLVKMAESATDSEIKVPGSNTVLCGVKVYDDAWAADGATIDAGIYTVEAKPDGAIKSVKTDKEWMYTRSAIKIGSTYYVLSSSFTGETSYYSNYSTSTWYKGTGSEIDALNVATDLAYDPVTGKVYGYFYDESTGDYTRFCEFSISLGESTKIADADRSVFAIACNKAGELYGVGSTGWFYKIDKTTGAQVPIGHTGLYPVDRNSMTFDDATGRLYWAATYETYEDGKRKWVSGLYEVNVHTGKLTKIKDLPGNASFSGLYAMPYQTPLTAPRAVSGIAVNFAHFGDTAADITFTAPTQNVDGSAISGNISVIVNKAGADTVVTDVAPGSTYTMKNVTLDPGYQTMSFTTANSEAQGELAWHTVYVGEDVPGTPENVKLSDVDGKAVLTWTPAQLGSNGGEYNKSTVAYKIVRQPDAVVVSDNCTATTFTDDKLGSGAKAYYYEVSAFTSKGMSAAAQSNKVTFGDGYTVPFTEGFDTSDAFDLWTIFDLNGGSTWAYDATNKRAYYLYDIGKKPGDDWLISPKFALKAGVTYRYSMYARTYSRNSYPESFKVMLGSEAKPEAMTTELLKKEDWKNVDGENMQVTFTVPADGIYHLGIYEYSASYMYRLDIDDVAISILDNNAPAAVTNFKVKAGEKGALTATITMNAPTTDTKGGTLNEISAVNVYRDTDTTPAHSFLNPAPGEALSWTDSAITKSGMVTYRAVAVNSAGNGEERSTQQYIGVDKPGAPRNLKLEDHDGNAVLTWDAPEEGVAGGYIDVSKLYYQVWRYDNYTKVADSLTVTTFTDTHVNATSQTLIDYVVFPFIDGERGQWVLSKAEIFGKAYSAPLTETFPNSDMKYYPWVTESDKLMSKSWTLENSGATPVATDQNGDGGFAAFHSVGEGLNIHARFSSPKIDISTLDNPELSFWMYHSHTEGISSAESIEIEVKNGNDEFEKIEDAKWMRDNGTTGWVRHTVSLESVKGCKNLRIGFLGTTAGGQDVYIDNISIANASTTDLEATAFTAPRRIARDVATTYSVKVTNLGNKTVDAYKVKLTDAEGSTLAESAQGSIASGEEQIVNFSLKFSKVGTVKLTAAVSCEGDQKAENNTATATTAVVEPVIPAPTNLAATVAESGVVSLAWRAADAHGAVTDSIESYTDFAIDGIGEWTMVDRDFDVTYKIKKDLDSYPNESAPKAFQVCNAKRLGIDIWDEGKPHSGDKMLMAMANVNYVNNDWMISPQLNGASQVISFFAKAFTAQGNMEERMRVLYSTTDTDPAHFVQVSRGEYVELPDSWTEYEYRVPEGAKYFAINCVSPGGAKSFAMFVDDLSFNDLSVPVLALKGYEVYRDGKLIATTTEPAYTDAALAPLAEATYTVRAVYDSATSAASNEVNVKVSGVDDILAGKTVQSVMYVNTLGVQSATPFDGVNIVVTRYTDGTTATTKLVK